MTLPYGVGVVRCSQTQPKAEEHQVSNASQPCQAPHWHPAGDITHAMESWTTATRAAWGAVAQPCQRMSGETDGFHARDSCFQGS